MSEPSTILSLHYLPCQFWFKQFLQHACIVDCHEHYVKQSFRNRTIILSANGPLALTIPVKKIQNSTVENIQIENDFNWKKNHWEAICSAYNSSPYFEFYKDRFEAIYFKKHESLMTFNLELIELCLQLMKTDKALSLSEQYETKGNDLREFIHPKRMQTITNPTREYLQVFTAKFRFIPNLSIIDLLFNCGPTSLDYLH